MPIIWVKRGEIQLINTEQDRGYGDESKQGMIGGREDDKET